MKLKQPTVAEIVAELDNPTDRIAFCRNIRHGVFHSWVAPLELFIEGCGGMWLRCDGSYAGFALRGSRHFGKHSRQKLKAAVNRWILRQAQRANRLDEAIFAAQKTGLPRDYQWSKSNIKKFEFGRDETLAAIRDYNR